MLMASLFLGQPLTQIFDSDTVLLNTQSYPLWTKVIKQKLLLFIILRTGLIFFYDQTKYKKTQSKTQSSLFTKELKLQMGTYNIK